MYHSSKSVHASDYGPMPTGEKMASGGHLGFSTFLIFHYMANIVLSIRLSISNFMKIGLTVQKLLAFLFSIRNALNGPQNWGFWGF